MKIEKAVRLESRAEKIMAAPEKLKAVLERFERVYLGAEFCENLLPDAQTARALSGFFLARGKKVTFLTPLLSQKGLLKLKSVLKALARPMAGGAGPENLEVTVNDFGALELAAELKLSFKINLGRLLYDNLFMFSRGKLQLTSGAALDFFLKAGISRFELSSTGKRVRVDFSRVRGRAGFKISLYYPYFNLTSTRACLPGLREPAPEKSPDPAICSRECGVCSFELTHPRVRERLTVRGNTVFLSFPEKFYKDESDLAAMRVDRLVYCPFP